MKQNCQETFLNILRKNKISVTIFLSNGIKLQGIITGFDNFAVILRRDSHVQLVYKHSISTIMPNSAFSFKMEEDGTFVNSPLLESEEIKIEEVSNANVTALPLPGAAKPTE
ncbi:RNA chaperone Hfq [Candidatus Hepatincolaceae symbiont of Richtersius coronifer]